MRPAMRLLPSPLLLLSLAVPISQVSVKALDNGVGRTPMMGWMAWVRFRCNVNCDSDPDNCISEKLFREMADAMVSGGWRDAGYTYLSLDDCWQANERASNGSIVPNATRFPSGMKALGDYIHSKGLHFGMYTAMGAESCCGYPAFGCHSVHDGGCEQARRDAQTYVSWGIDYIKVDSCRNATGGPADGSQFNTTHPLVSSFFLDYGQAANRPVLYHPSGISLRQNAGDRRGGPGPHPHQFKLYSKIANMWRAFKDMQPEWAEVNEIIEYWAADTEAGHPKTYDNEWEDWLSVSKPGVFQDPDALLVGNANTAASCSDCANTSTSCHPNDNVACICCGSLSAVEEQTNMVFWAMWAAPLEIAADLRTIAPESAAILQNQAVIAVNQDPLGYQARRVSNIGGLQVWRKELVDGSVAVALYNSGDQAQATISLVFETVGFSSCDRVLVHDLIKRQDLGVRIGELDGAKAIPPHGVAMYNLSIVW